MIVGELFIIYLAAAAPFGVSRFLSEQAGGADVRGALLKAAGSALAWPLTSLPRLLRRVRGAKTSSSSEHDEQRVERAKRAAVNALRSVEDLLEDSLGRDGEAGRHALFTARESVERYAGLTLAAAQASPAARPTAREMELCRIAGRGGDDLLTAGRCVHRRNVTRLVAHRERAATEMVQALSAVCALARDARPFNSEEHLRAAEVEWISDALRLAVARVVELLLLLDDDATAADVARLLEAERARADRAGGGEGEASCTTQAVPTAFASSRLRTRTSHGG